MAHKTEEVIILGGTGNGTVIAAAIGDAVRRGEKPCRVIGFLNDREPEGSMIGDWPVLGTLDRAAEYLERGCRFINTIYRIDGQDERLARFEQLGIPPERLFGFVHPLAYVAPGAILGPGTVVMPQCAISYGARLGTGCLLMCGATVGHDTEAGDYGHFAAQSCVSSFVILGRGVHIGLNATVHEGIYIGDGATVGMGSVLLNNVGPREIWVGNPARFLRKAE